MGESNDRSHYETQSGCDRGAGTCRACVRCRQPRVAIGPGRTRIDRFRDDWQRGQSRDEQSQYSPGRWTGWARGLVYGVVQTVGIDSIVIEITDAPGQANVAVGASFSVARSDWDVVSVSDTAAVVTYTSSLDLYTMALWNSATGALRLPLTAHPRTSLGHQQVFDSFNEVPTLDTCGWTPQPGLSEANDAGPRSILEGYLAGTTEAFQFEAFRELHREARRQAVEIAEAAPRVEDAVASKR